MSGLQQAQAIPWTGGVHLKARQGHLSANGETVSVEVETKRLRCVRQAEQYAKILAVEQQDEVPLSRGGILPCPTLHHGYADRANLIGGMGGGNVLCLDICQPTGC